MGLLGKLVQKFTLPVYQKYVNTCTVYFILVTIKMSSNKFNLVCVDGSEHSDRAFSCKYTLFED